MLTRTDSDSDLAIHDILLTRPPLAMLKSELETALNDASPYIDQYRFDYEQRFCLWQAQSRDGRKWQEKTGSTKKVRPWDGASDVRTFSADAVINEQVDVMMSALKRSSIQVTALQSTNLDWSQRMTTLLQWLLRNHLAQELDAEFEKGANWRQQFGIATMGVWWDQQWRLQRTVRRLEDLITAAQTKAAQGDMSGVAGLARLADPALDEQSIDAITQMAPILDRQGARRILRNLREKGEAEIPSISILKNQPCIEALRVFLDVFFPVETKSLQKARWIQRRQVMPIATLEAMVQQKEWDEEWARELVETGAGKSFGALMDYRSDTLRAADGFFTGSSPAITAGMLPSEQYVEVWTAYYTGVDRRTGAPAMMETVWSPHVAEKYGHHDLFGYDHQQMPFTELVRERVEDALVDSRSVCEIAATFQNTIKTQRDGRNDYTQLTTVPPLLVPLWRSGAEIKMGPAAQIPMKPNDDLRYLSPPQWTGVADKAEESAEIALAKYFGSIHEQVPEALTAMKQERLVTRFLGEVGAVTKQMLQLCQQYMSEVTAERVVGQMRIPLRVSREEIQGQFNLLLAFDATNLNPQLAAQKLEAFQKYVLAVDTEGTVNRAALAQFGARMLDPYLADEVVGDPQVAAKNEVEDEKKNLGLIMGGVEPPMRPEGQNYKLRLATLMQEVQANPYMPQRLQSQPDSLAMLKARIQHLQAMDAQYSVNAQTGRTGAEPGLSQLQEQQGAVA